MQPSNRELLIKLHHLQQEAIEKHQNIGARMATIVASGAEPDWPALWLEWEEANRLTQRIGDTLGLVAKLVAFGKGSV